MPLPLEPLFELFEPLVFEPLFEPLLLLLFELFVDDEEDEPMPDELIEADEDELALPLTDGF